MFVLKKYDYNWVVAKPEAYKEERLCGYILLFPLLEFVKMYNFII